MLAEIAALAAGAMMGTAFAMIQNRARRLYEKRQAMGALKSEWSVMRGSGSRIAFFVIGLAIVQLVCPRLFQDAIKWWVSGGVAAGYGVMLFLQLRQKLAR